MSSCHRKGDNANSFQAVLGWCGALTIHKQLTVIRNVSEVIETPFIPSNRVNQQTQDGMVILHPRS